MRPIALLPLLVTLFCAPAAAQTQVTRPAPRLTVTDGGSAKALAITSLDVEARVVGHLVETSMTMTFYNSAGRVLEGDLVFPLPAGSTVSGYALDVDGALVDGVVVDKIKARRVFEAEVRKGVDPGLVERVAGAAFRTRVFPIPARGSRTIRVSWVSEVALSADGARFTIPLGFEEPIRDVHLRVDVVGPDAAPRVSGEGLEGLDFEAWEDRRVAETTLRDALLDRPVTIELPSLPSRPVAVERAPDGSVWFAVHQHVAPPARVGRIEPSRVGILWDASLSRAGDHERELGLLRAWLDTLGPRRTTVDVTVFSNEAEPAVPFLLPGGEEALLQHLRGVVYDGGTRLGALADVPAADLYLLFSDGVSNLGAPEPPAFAAPVFALDGASIANHDALRSLALGSGGAWIDLSAVADADAVAAIGRAPFAFRGASGPGLGESYPRIPEPVDGVFSFAGRLEAPTATVTLRFGGSGAEAVRTVVVSADDAVDGDLLRRFWAGKKVSDLAVGGARNEPAMAAVGKRYGIVTPGTSLLVLERLDQYLEHDVRPPASLADMRADWDRTMAQRAAQKTTEDERKLERIVALWRERVAWWEKTFDLTPRVVAGKKSAEGRGGLSRSGSGYGGGGQAASAPAMLDAAPMEEASGEADDEAERAPRKKAKGGGGDPGPSIALKAWDPQTPYLDALKAAAPGERVAVYIAQRALWGDAPAFFLDASDFFAGQGERRVALRVLSNLVELELEDPALLRVFAHRLTQLDELDLAISTFDRIRDLRPDEPQSHRDRALALAARGDRRAGDPGLRVAALNDYQAALDGLARVVMDEWERFAEIELIALVELNDVLPKARKLGDVRVPVDARLVQALDMDIRIVMSWDADMTDMDLHVAEPSGEEAYYGHNRTAIGGRVSRDFTQGYGPEEYSIRRAMKGTYTLRTKFFGSSAASMQGAVTLYVDLYTDYGRPTQKKESITIRLAESKDTFTVGEITFEPRERPLQVAR